MIMIKILLMCSQSKEVEQEEEEVRGYFQKHREIIG